MKNGESDAQIPELVAKAMVGTYEYSLEQLKRLPHAEEMLNDVLNPSTAAEGAEAPDAGATQSKHAVAGAIDAGGTATQDLHACAASNGAGHEDVQTRPWQHGDPIEGQGGVARAHGGAISRPKPVRVVLQTAHRQVPAGSTGARLPGTTTAEATQGPFHHHHHHHQQQQQQQQAHLPHSETGAAASVGGMAAAKKPAGGGKGQGGKAMNGKPMSKQQAKQLQQARRVKLSMENRE